MTPRSFQHTIIEREKKTNIQTDRHTDRQTMIEKELKTNVQTDRKRHTDQHTFQHKMKERKTNRKTEKDRQTDTQRDRHEYILEQNKQQGNESTRRFQKLYFFKKTFHNLGNNDYLTMNLKKL